MLNRFIGIGRWSQEIKLTYTPSGKAVANSTIAINEKYGDRENTVYLPVVMWNKLAENVAEYSKIGRLVSIEGRVSVRSWDSDNGKRYVTEIIADNVRFLESSRNNQQQTSSDPFTGDGEPIDIDDESLPF